MGKKSKAAPEPEAPPKRNKLAAWGGVGLATVLIAGCALYFQREQLQDTRDAAFKIESGWPGGRLREPFVIMHVENLREQPITNAKVETKLALLPPAAAKQIYQGMEDPIVQTIQAKSKEQQILYGKGAPYSDGQMEALFRGDLVLISAMRITWKDRGDWLSSTASRCFTFTPHGEFACEDLINDPTNARAYVAGVFRRHPQLRRDWIGPNADGSGDYLP